MAASLPAIEWSTPAGELRAWEPTAAEVATHAAALAAAYNEPSNAALLGHTALLDAADVIEHYATLRRDRGVGFLLYRDGRLAGDADLRGVASGAAEFAFLIADPAAQGKGLGTRFALMIHAFGFARLGLDRIYASVIPHNTGSLRVFAKLGYVSDDGPAARAYADPGDVSLRIDRETFTGHHAAALAELRFAPR